METWANQLSYSYHTSRNFFFKVFKNISKPLSQNYIDIFTKYFKFTGFPDGPLIISKRSKLTGSESETKLVAIPFLIAPAPSAPVKPLNIIESPVPPEPTPNITFVTQEKKVKRL